MMTTSLSVTEMRANVLKSRGHVAKQEGIVQRLTAQGHADMARDAAELLETMKDHLEVEITMLTRLEHGADP